MFQRNQCAWLLSLLATVAISGYLHAKPILSGISPNPLQIKPSTTNDAIAHKRIYRSIQVTRLDAHEALDVIVPSSPTLQMRVMDNECKSHESKKRECTFTLELIGEAGPFSEHIKIVGSSSDSDAFDFKITGQLEDKPFVGIETKRMEAYERVATTTPYTNVKVLSCNDLDAINPISNLSAQCTAMQTAFLGLKIEPDHQLCIEEENAIERSQCSGMIRGIQLESCEGLDPIATQVCTTIAQGATKQCNDKDRDCLAVQRMLHGYMNCMTSGVDEWLPLCVAQQNAYIDGISANWVRRLLEQSPTHASCGSINPDIQLYYVPSQRVQRLGFSDEELRQLMNRYPTLMRSTLLNTPLAKEENTSLQDLWSEIEQHLYPEQTVGFELECPAMKLDISSGSSPRTVSRHLRGYTGFMETLSWGEISQKKTKLDAKFEKIYADKIKKLTKDEIWNAKATWPYFNTYGFSLFHSEEKNINIPLLDVTLESRYKFSHFPHVEFVSAPLTQLSSPLNRKNVMGYMSDIIAKVCAFRNPQDVHFKAIEDWRQLAYQTPINSEEGPLHYESKISPIFEDTPMSCNVPQMNHCHVQSNVGVFLDQLFTDTFLIQTMGKDSAGRSDSTYYAAWSVAKKAFSTLQWEQASDRPIDIRNHAAGIFTYMVYELFNRSILYAGKYGFWKGTITTLMKTKLRKVWQMLHKDIHNENELDLFHQATLSLYQGELPEELRNQIKPILQAYISSGTPDVLVENPVYNDAFVQTVSDNFREMLWTIALASEDSYRRSKKTDWGYVVASDRNLEYVDENKSKHIRKAFISGDSYSGHDGSQLDLGKEIDPVPTHNPNHLDTFERVYAVIETRHGGADFNEAIFWRCHEKDRSTVLPHQCRYWN